jgi:hypothetical protein
VGIIGLIDYFKFYHKVNKNRIYTCKLLGEIFVVMWEANGELDCTTYQINEAADNLKSGVWVLVE